jgi:hypothetical protein
MPIDFSALVLGPCMNTFAKGVSVTPIASNPMGAPYTARGIWIVENVTVMADYEAPVSSRNIKFGIKLDDFPFPPAQGDYVTVAVKDLPMGYKADNLDPSASVDFVIDNDQPDGQGGSTLFLKRKPQ